MLKPGRPIQYGTTESLSLPASVNSMSCRFDVLSNHQIDDWMRKSEEPEEDISDEDVGLAKEPNPDELPLIEFAEIDCKRKMPKATLPAML